MTERVCDATDRVPVDGPSCAGWFPEGFPWHGCCLEPGHGMSSRRVRHVCKCGHEWIGRRVDP